MRASIASGSIATSTLSRSEKRACWSDAAGTVSGTSPVEAGEWDRGLQEPAPDPRQQALGVGAVQPGAQLGVGVQRGLGQEEVILQELDQARDPGQRQDLVALVIDDHQLLDRAAAVHQRQKLELLRLQLQVGVGGGVVDDDVGLARTRRLVSGLDAGHGARASLGRHQGALETLPDRPPAAAGRP